MVQSKGFRRKTRTLLRKGYKSRGMPGLARTLLVFKKGEFVDCVIDSSVHKGMPHKTFHGRTGKIVVVHETSLSVLFYVREGNRLVEKVVTMRPEHLRKSKCNLWQKERSAKIEEERKVAAEEGKNYVVEKISPKGPRPSFYLNLKEVEPIEIKNIPFIKNY